MNTHPVDTSFAPWSLMTPDPAHARRQATPVRETAVTALSTPDDDRHGPQPVEDDGYMFGEDGFTFADFLAIVNPLQHLPIIGTIYREITGDEIAPGARLAGGVLFGGPLGLASAVLNTAIEAHSGRDIGGHVLTAFAGGAGEDGAGAALADSSPGADSFQGASGGDAQAGQIAAGGAGGMEIPMEGGGFGGFAAGGPGRSAPDAAQMAALFGGMVAGAPAGRAMPAARYDTDAAGAPAADGFSSPATGGPRDADRAAGRDFAGIARISPKMAEHLAMLAQQTAPAAAPPAAAAAAEPPLPQPFARNHGAGNQAAGNPFAPAAAAPPAAPGSHPTRTAGAAATLAGPTPRASTPTDPAQIRDAMAQALRRYEAMKQNQS